MLPYKCETCNQRFSVKWRLVHHQKTHEPEKEAKSDESDSCSTPSPKKVVLKNPEVLQDFNTHECPVCHINFVGKKQLERHERAHGNKKFYQCDRCHLAFFWKSNFNRHRKQSCTRRAFQCEKCHRTFNKKFHFLRHRNCHDKDQKPFEGPSGDSFDVQEAAPSTSSQLDRTRDGPSTSKGQETDPEVVAVVSLISPIKGRPRASKLNLNLNSSDKNATESKSDEKSEEELAADPNFEPKRRKPRTKYGRRKKPMTQYEKKKKPRTNYERKHKCDLCHLGFRFKCDLGRHRRTHDSVKPYPCDQCDLGFNWKSNLVRHQKRMHLAEKTFSCDSCGEGFPRKYHLARHRTNSHENPNNDRKASLRSKRRSGSYDCNCDCGSDSNPVVIQLHPSRSEDSAAVKEEPASSSKDRASDNGTQTSKSQEVNIVYLHACYDEIKPDSREECNPQRSREQSETVSIEEVYDCNWPQRRRIDHEDCKHEAPARKRLRKEVREFVCSVCSRVFTRKSCHLQHERSHYKQPLRCEWCLRTFARKSVFERHQRIHTGERPFRCEICSCYFRQKSQLVQHKKIHSGSKPHECEVCKRRFNRKSVLVRHRMIHTGEKPFECEVCHLCFNQKSILVQHLKIHTGLKPYKCKKCNYSFTQKWNYRRHKQKVHISGRTLSIKCNTCDSSFPRKRILIQHEKIHQRKKFVFHIYNTRFAKKRCTRKDKLKEASKHLDQAEEIHVHSGKNDDSQNCDMIDDGKTLPKVCGEKEIADFPDHCVPVDIYIRNDFHNRKSSAEDRKNNPLKIQNAKGFEEKDGEDLESEKKTNCDEISEDKNFLAHLDSSEAVQMGNSAETEDKSNVEDCKKNEEENVVGNQQMIEEINVISVKEISPVTECVGLQSNSSPQERQEHKNDIEESHTHLEILNNREKGAVGSAEKLCANSGLKENNSIPEMADDLPKGCSENLKSVESAEICKSSAEEQQSKNAPKNDWKEDISTVKTQAVSADNVDCQEAKNVAKNSDINSNSSDQNIGNKRCGERVLADENLDKLGDMNQEDGKHSEIDVKTGDVSEIPTSNKKYQQPSTFLSNQDTPERILKQNNARDENSRESKESEKRIRTQSQKWNSDVGDKTFQCFKENNDERQSDEIPITANDSEKPAIHESSMDSSSSEQVEGNISIKISTNSGVESNVSDQPVTNATEKEFTSRVRDSSAVENRRFLAMKHGALENTKHNHNIIWINRKAQKDVHNSENFCNVVLEENSSHVQPDDEMECANETREALKINKTAEEIVGTQGSKLHRKANRSKRRLKYKTMFGRKLINGAQENTHREEENVREALSFLKIHDESAGVSKVTNDTKEGQISITRQIFICQTKVIESIVKIGKKEDNIPHSTANFIKVSPIVYPAKPVTNRLEQASHLDDRKSGPKVIEEDRKNLTAKMSFAEERFSHYAENFEDINSDKNFIQKHNEIPSEKVFSDQTPGLACGIHEELDKEREFQNNIYTLQSRETNAQNAEEATTDRGQVVKVCEEELRNETALYQEKSCEILKSSDLNLSENKESTSLNHGEVEERSDSALEEIATLQNQINETCDETNCEFSEKTASIPETSPRERQTGVNDLLEEIDRNPKPIQCGEINYTENSCEGINSNENFVKYRDVSNVIYDSALDANQFSRNDPNHLQKNSNEENYIPGNTDNQVSSSGIGPDCGFPLNSQTGQDSSEQTEIFTETQVGSERGESAQKLHLYEKNGSDAFGFIDFSTLTSPERFSDFRTKSEIPSFNANKSTIRCQQKDDAQNCLFHERSHENNSLDLMNDTGTDLEFTPLHNLRPDRAFTECGEGVLSYQEMSENFSTPNKNRSYQRAGASEAEKNNSNFAFLSEVQGGLRPQTYHEYIVPFENIYQHSTSTIPVSSPSQSIPSYTEAFSRPGLALHHGNSVYTALYPESVANNHDSVSRKDVGYTAKSSTSNRNRSYGHHQYEDYMQNFCRDGNNSTPQDAENQPYSDIFRLQQINSVEDYFRNEDVQKHAGNTRNDPNTSYKYQVFTPQTCEEPAGRYEEAYTFPTRCEESYNYSVRQEKVRTYAVRHEEVHRIEDLVRFEKTCLYPAPATEMSSMEAPSQYKESGPYQSAFSSDAAFSSNYFRMDVPANRGPVSVNVQPSENSSVSSLQLSPEQTEKNSKGQQKIALQTPQELSRMRARRPSTTNMHFPQDSPNKQTPSGFNTQTPQGLFRTNVATPQNSSWTNSQIPQGTRLAAQTLNTPIRLIKPSPQYPTNHPQGFVPSKGLMLLTSPGASFQNKNGCLQNQDWRRRMDLDFDRNRRIHFESARATASDNEHPKGIFIERHFRCDRCDHSFARKEDLIRHRFTAHEKFRVVKPTSYLFMQ
ncbi:Zinc finger protein 845 [Araneus ventricosus]|uniref:Zinc finger protein 845 n=1 Tax=Araneus ventricosus TaxID=182803 RepID=A0A4Y2RIR4_ARAVE|nr:Zinc finger protein 845 [Araneus ventricosus]